MQVGAKGGRRPLVVACLHAFWDPTFTQVKRAQAQHVREEVERFNVNGHPVVIGGDFNSLPGEEVYREMQGATPGPLPPACETRPLASAYSRYQSMHGSQFPPEEQRGGGEWSIAGWPACEGARAATRGDRAATGSADAACSPRATCGGGPFVRGARVHQPDAQV